MVVMNMCVHLLKFKLKMSYGKLVDIVRRNKGGPEVDNY